MLIARSNSKLGRLPSFSLPAITTCPGKTRFCDLYCYAAKGRLNWNRSKMHSVRNFEASKSEDFVERIVGEILSLHTKVLRLHVSGDFYDVPYIRKWVAIANRYPDVVFFGSTRSWRAIELNETLKKLAALPNVCLRASIDFTHLDRPDSSWNTWSIDAHGEPCPHDYGLVGHCTDCGRCWRNGKFDMTLKLRWGNKYVNLSPELL